MDQVLRIEFDGGSRGNPGPAGIGVVVRAADGTTLLTLGRYIGAATNNVAEYQAVITGLEKALELGAQSVQVCGDSELIIRQLRGEYRVRNPGLQPLHRRAKALLARFKHVSLMHNQRKDNSLADRLANLAMDRRADVLEVQEPSADDLASATAVAGRTLTCPRCGCQIQVLRPPSIRRDRAEGFVCPCGAQMA
mgnify:CR=1 FL=1